MTNFLRIATAVVLITGAGLVHGRWTNRWGTSSALAALAARIDQMPMVIGNWHGTAFELPAEDRAMAGVEAWFSRVYSNPSRGASVSVLLLGGLPGKIATHAPDACYPSEGYTLDFPASFSCHYGSDTRQSNFKTALARREGTQPSVLRMFWGWNASQGWSAPEEPRWMFAHQPWLCKLYVIRETAGEVVDPQGDPCNDFMKVLLPELDRLVFSGSRLGPSPGGEASREKRPARSDR
jgi:hypothetical protein